MKSRQNHASKSTRRLASLAVVVLAALPPSLQAQSSWIGNSSNDINLAGNWTSGVPTAAVGIITTAGTAGSSLSLTADTQFGGGVSPASNALLFNGDAFTIAGNSATRQLTIGGQGLAIDTTNTITIDAPRVRRNATNTFEFLGSSGNLVINGDYSNNITGASAVTSRVDFTGATGANNTLTINGNIVNVFVGAAGSGAGNLALNRTGSGSGNKVVLNNASNSGITGAVTIGAGTELHLGNGGANGTIAGSTSMINTGRFVINQSDSVTQGTEFTSAAISGGGVLVQSGAGTTTLTANNTFSGGVIINAGKLTINANERLNNVSAVTLNGGSFDTAGFTETLGVLTLGGNATLDLGTTGLLRFSDSSGASWAGGSTLTIAGTFVSGSSIRFGTSNTALGSGQLAQIAIDGFNSIGLDSGGFLVASAIPEPSAFAALAGLATLGFVASRRRRASGC
jgi:autotransporter-associated beta strand protein